MALFGIEIDTTGDVDLYGTKITALPDNLSVGGDLYLRHSEITALPDNLKVGGKVIGFQPPVRKATERPAPGPC